MSGGLLMINQSGRTVDSKAFKIFIIAAIIVAGIVVGLETVPEIAEKYAGPMYVLDRVIISIFIGELLLKLAAEWPQPGRYFLDAWNI